LSRDLITNNVCIHDTPVEQALNNIYNCSRATHS